MTYRIQILVTSDKLVSRVGYVKRANEGDVYFNFTIDTSDTHISRHQSGTMHFKHKRKKILSSAHTRQRIDDPAFTIENITTSAFSVDFLSYVQPYKQHKTSDEVFAVDLRQLSPGTPHLGIWLVAPSYVQQAIDLVTHLGAKQYRVIRRMSPWLMLAAFAPPQHP
jgi:hypothetical protein